MLILDATTKSLKIVLAGAVATTQLPVTAHYTDITTTAYTPGSNDTVTNSTTVVEFVAAPAASTQRHVESISVYNVDTASATVTIQYVSAGGTRQIIKVVLLTLETLIYEDGAGWQIIDANGNLKTSFPGMAPAGTAESDFIVAGTSPFAWIKKTLVEAKALLGLVITAGKTITVTDNTTLAGPASVTVAGPIEIATNAESLTGTDTARAVTPDDLKYVLDSRLPLFYGVSWDESADTYVRTGATAGQAVAVTLANAFLPIQRRMRGCLLKDDGTVNYYLSATDWTKKEDGATASVLTGADGQVMVQIPKFWYRYGYAGTTHTWEVSPVPLAGFDPHPAFYKDGAWVDYRYIGAYEGVLYDTSLAAYVDGIYQTAVSCVFALTGSTMTIASRSNWATNLTVGQKIVISGTVSNNGTKTVASKVSGTQITTTEALVNETAASTVISTERDYTATTGDKLSSVSGKAAINQLTRANLRAIALNRGTGWRQQDYDLTWTIQLLFIIEYASFYSQSVLGAGISNVADWAAYNDYNPIALSGNGNSIGNANGNNAGSTSAATESTKYLKYRGIENFYGHSWKFIDGFNINGNIPYRTNVGANFADDTTTNYTRMVDSLGIDVTLHNVNGYPATIQKMKWGFLAASVGASGSTKITDYYYQNTGWRIATFGGDAYDGVCDGAFCWYLLYVSGLVARTIVGRLGF